MTETTDVAERGICLGSNTPPRLAEDETDVFDVALVADKKGGAFSASMFGNMNLPETVRDWSRSGPMSRCWTR